MTDAFVDTDIIIRLLTGDDPVKQASAAALFRQVRSGLVTVAAPITVIADAVFVLSAPRLYRVPRADTAAMLKTLVRTPGFKLDQKSIVLRALDLYGSANLDFGDAIIVATMEQRGARRLYSYDRHFDQVPGITRQEP